jgi:hypothetical protein
VFPSTKAAVSKEDEWMEGGRGSGNVRAGEPVVEERTEAVEATAATATRVSVATEATGERDPATAAADSLKVF